MCSYGSRNAAPTHEIATRSHPAAKYEVMLPSDAELIESSWADAEAFARIFDRHFQAVFGFCARRVGTSTGEELAGETFLRAFRARRLYDVSQQNARPWLFGVARNVVREHLRSARREAVANRRSLSMDLPESFDPAVLAAAAQDARQEVRAMARILSQLPGDEVEALFLHVGDGLSYDECARVLGVPVGTVHSRLNRVRRRLRQKLGQRSSFADLPPRRIGSSSSIRQIRLLGGVDEQPT